MKSKNTGEIYNRLSFRSPFRKTNIVKPVNTSNIKIEPISGKNDVIPLSVVKDAPSAAETQPIHIVNNAKPIIVKQNIPKMNNRVSCRSPLNNQKREVKKSYEDPIYNIVTKTPSGEQVKVPTENKSTFIKFKEKTAPLAMPIKQVIQKELLPIKKCKFDEALLIYENNQSYYLDKIMCERDEDVVLQLIKEIDVLEKWFCGINEPKPKNNNDVKDWRLRNQFKKDYGYSKYFDIDLLYYTDYKN